jgi:hypothetical protein
VHHVNAPDKPIVIELNINIEQEVVYRLAADAGRRLIATRIFSDGARKSFCFAPVGRCAAGAVHGGPCWRRRAIRPMPPRAGRAGGELPTGYLGLWAPRRPISSGMVEDLNIKRKAVYAQRARPSMPRWRPMPSPPAAT